MKFFRIFSRNIRDAILSVGRNFSLSLASVSSITITLLVVSISLILTYNVDNFATLVERDVTIVAFLDKDATNDEIIEVETAIKNMDGVESFVYQSKAAISQEMMESSEIFENIMKNWDEDENPLQDTFLIKVENIEEIGFIAARIQDLDPVDSTKYGEGMIEQLVSLFDVVRKVSAGIVIALIVVTAFLISNTIKIAIFSRKREIEIMRLVGASNLNIKVPFIIEGLFLGLIGALIPIVATVYSYNRAYENFEGQFFGPFIRLVEPFPFLYTASAILAVLGIIVGMFGSWWAVRKHLRI